MLSQNAIGLLGGLFLFGVPGAAFAETFDFDDANAHADQVDAEITSMRSDLNVVRRGYGQTITMAVGRVERRLREGEIHFLLGDYMRASIVLLDVVEDESHKSHPRYGDCVFILAESLRHSRNFVGSRRYYEEILPQASGERLKDIVLGLLEIAGATNRYEDVDRYIARLRQAGTLSRPDVDYIYGKMLFKGGDKRDQQKLVRAYEVFRNVPSTTGVAPQSAYYAGVTLVKLGRYEEAINQFKEAIARLRGGSDPGQLKDLAYLSLGRLYQELGDVSTSADAYQEISQDSPYFGDMLYELAWAHVRSSAETNDPEERKKAFNRALRATELLMATAPSSRLYPQARILQGNLQIRLGAEESAYDTFQTIVDRYGGARAKLDTMLRETTNAKEFFDHLVAADLERVGTAAILPPIALSWALEEESMDRAVTMQKDLKDSDKFMRESRELVETLMESLAGEQRYSMFPGLAGARDRALSIRNKAANSQRELLILERRVLWPTLSLSERAQIDQVHQRAREIEADLVQLPQTEDQVLSSKEEIKRRYQLSSQRAYVLTQRLSSMAAQVVAVEAWLNQNREQMAPEEVALTEKRLIEAREKISANRLVVDALQSDIRKESMVAEGDAGGEWAKRVRGDYNQVVAEEIAMLRSHREKVDGSLRGVLARVDQQRSDLSVIESDLLRLQSALDAQVAEKVAEVQQAIAKEVVHLNEYEQEHASLRQQTDGLLGPVATDTLNAVGRQFMELVLKADVGIIDVAWARKQAETDKVNNLIKEQQDRTLELESEFEDVLKD